MIKNLCKCGCGEFVLKETNSYIQGHNPKGKKISIKHKDKLSKLKKGKTWEEIFVYKGV